MDTEFFLFIQNWAFLFHLTQSVGNRRKSTNPRWQWQWGRRFSPFACVSPPCLSVWLYLFLFFVLKVEQYHSKNHLNFKNEKIWNSHSFFFFIRAESIDTSISSSSSLFSPTPSSSSSFSFSCSFSSSSSLPSIASSTVDLETRSLLADLFTYRSALTEGIL